MHRLAVMLEIVAPFLFLIQVLFWKQLTQKT